MQFVPRDVPCYAGLLAKSRIHSKGPLHFLESDRSVFCFKRCSSGMRPIKLWKKIGRRPFDFSLAANGDSRGRLPKAAAPRPPMPFSVPEVEFRGMRRLGGPRFPNFERDVGRHRRLGTGLHDAWARQAVLGVSWTRRANSNFGPQSQIARQVAWRWGKRKRIRKSLRESRSREGRRLRASRHSALPEGAGAHIASA